MTNSSQLMWLTSTAGPRWQSAVLWSGNRSVMISSVIQLCNFDPCLFLTMRSAIIYWKCYFFSENIYCNSWHRVGELYLSSNYWFGVMHCSKWSMVMLLAISLKMKVTFILPPPVRPLTVVHGSKFDGYCIPCDDFSTAFLIISRTSMFHPVRWYLTLNIQIISVLCFFWKMLYTRPNIELYDRLCACIELESYAPWLDAAALLHAQHTQVNWSYTTVNGNGVYSNVLFFF